jgi:hypothetical protein
MSHDAGSGFGDRRWSALSADVVTAPYAITGWSSRTTVVRLASGGLLVVNPGAPLAATARAQLQSLGEVECLLALNHFHHLGIVAWQNEFGAVPVVASAQAHARLAKRGYAPLREPAEIESILPAGASFLLPAETRTGELWLRLAIGGRTAWIVGDAFFHVLSAPRNLAGLFLRFSGTVPGLRIGGTFKFGHLRDRRAYREWLLHLVETDPPDVLVPAHGEVAQDVELVASMVRLIEERL